MCTVIGAVQNMMDQSHEQAAPISAAPNTAISSGATPDRWGCFMVALITMQLFPGTDS